MKYSNREMTFGFEIEGLFSRKLLTQLEKEGFDDDDFHSDGSVQESDIFSNIPNHKRKTIVTDVTELSLGIFHSRKKVVDMLSRFSEPDYYMDKSCGLHLHIGFGEDGTPLKNAATDFGFISSLQKFAYGSLCEHIRERKTNEYCKYYRDLDQFREYFAIRHEKYRFVKNHEQGTWEFRFLAPCEHKVDNAKKFLDYFFCELRNLSTKKIERVKLSVASERTVTQEFYIYGQDKTLQINEVVNPTLAMAPDQQAVIDVMLRHPFYRIMTNDRIITENGL